MISDMAFDGWGTLWGIFPDYSDSSGLWSSDDYGDTWNVSFYGDNMSAVGLDAFGNLFVGWEADVGIAWYDPQAPPPGLTFLNDGLPSLNINKIQLNPSMSAPAIFICTDSGAYCSYDYLVGHVEPVKPASSLHIYPNPARENLTVTCKHSIQELIITTLDGERIFCSNGSSTELTISIRQWAEGIYIIQCRTSAGSVCKKWILER
jgi:hypothetical protein